MIEHSAPHFEKVGGIFKSTAGRMVKAPACPSTQQMLDGHGVAFAHPTASHCDDDNAGRGLQPRWKRLDAPKRRYITKSRPVSSVIFQR